jgi:arylformamidase
MKIKFTDRGTTWVADLKKGQSIAIPLRDGLQNPNCFWAPPPVFEPLRSGDFVGSLEAGAPVNFYNVRFNPHGNGTHTECIGHILQGDYTIAKSIREAHLFAKLVTIWPIAQENGDRIITKAQIAELIAPDEADALVIRTMPNTTDKHTRSYSGANPPYLEPEACAYLAACDLDHLLVDLPSLDREQDGGAMAGHKAWWQVPTAPRLQATITEMVFVPDRLQDGYYLLNLQVAAFELDAAPSRPVLYSLTQLSITDL